MINIYTCILNYVLIFFLFSKDDSNAAEEREQRKREREDRRKQRDDDGNKADAERQQARDERRKKRESGKCKYRIYWLLNWVSDSGKHYVRSDSGKH